MADDRLPSLSLSVVIIGRNEGERLVRCIQSVRNMRGDFPKPEIFYIDSASTDGSPEKARSLGVNVIVLQEGVLNAARGRNAGWHVANTEYILFLDGDTVVDPDFVRSSVNYFKAPKIVAVWGNRRELFPRKNFFHRACDLEWTCYPYGESEYFGGDAIVKRSVLEKVGGYDESLSAGEDAEMCGRIRKDGYKIFHADIPMTQHDRNMSFKDYCVRAARTGYAYAEVASRFPGSVPDSWIKKKWQPFLHVLLLVLSTGAFVFLALEEASLWPIGIWGLLGGALCLRTSWKNRKKTKDLRTLFYYALHSHFIKAPILWGQAAYLFVSRKGK